MQPKFSADEKVLCYHGPLLYEAKILKHKKEGGSYSYFVHYQVRSFIESIVEKCFLQFSIARVGTKTGMSGCLRPG